MFCDEEDHRITNIKHPAYMSPAIDYRAKESTKLYAPTIYGNKVEWKTRLYTDPQKGQVIELEHNGEKQYRVILGHISEYAVKHDQRIKSGDLIGYSGGNVNATYPVGISTGPHLHTEFILNNEHVQPFTEEIIELRPYKIGASEEQQKYIDYAWDISHDKKFIEMIEGESSAWEIDKKSIKIGANGYYDYGFCQINKGWHPEVFTDQFFTNYEYQLNICWKYFSGGVKFYGAERDVANHFEWK